MLLLLHFSDTLMQKSSHISNTCIFGANKLDWIMGNNYWSFIKSNGYAFERIQIIKDPFGPNSIKNASLLLFPVSRLLPNLYAFITSICIAR